MRREKQRLADYLGHLLEAIERIDRYTDAMDERAFLEPGLRQQVRQLLEGMPRDDNDSRTTP